MTNLKKVLETFNKFIALLLISTLLIHCSGSPSDEGDGVVTYIKISSDKTTIIIGDKFVMKATDNLNNDVTSESKFYINGALNPDGNIFTPHETGEYTITAKYGTFQSKPLQIQTEAATGINYVHRILYEDFTGTWCGNCPIATARYENLINQNDKVVFLGIHGPQGTNDPYINSTSQGIIDALKVQAYPTILLNRKTKWSTSNNNYTDMSLPLSLIKASSKIGISATSRMNGRVVSGTVNLNFAENFQGLKIAMYIVENNLVYDQHNYFNGSGGKPVLHNGENPIVGYVHHNVVRDRLTDISGENIPDSQSQNSTFYSKNFSYTVPSEYNIDNTKLIIVVMDSNGEAQNSREITLNTDNTLETIN
ncbi:Omp28-related outer membrane protein [Weeksellaceae bacterium A-14]